MKAIIIESKMSGIRSKVRKLCEHAGRVLIPVRVIREGSQRIILHLPYVEVCVMSRDRQKKRDEVACRSLKSQR